MALTRSDSGIDTLTGRCSCVYDFASSDGATAVGNRDDCGYRDIHAAHGVL